MSRTSACQVLIVGSGPSGLLLALTLAKNGINVRVIEKDSHHQVGQRGPGMQPRSLELFHMLGTLPDVLKYAIPIGAWCSYKMPEGREVMKAHLHKYEDTPSVPYANPVLLGQCKHVEILRAHLATYGIHVELGTELVSLEQDSERVTAQVVVRKDGTESKETIQADYLVSAEGAKSVTRKQLGLKFLGETRDDTRALIADVYIKGLAADSVHQWGDWQSACVFIFPTIYDGLFTLTLTGKDFDPNEYLHDRGRLLEYVYNTTNRRDLEFGEIQWTSEWRPNIRMANKFGEGRAFLVGDAAHVHSPTGGQGNNTGAQDSFNLGWKLALVLKKLSPPSILETYSAERLPVVQEMLNFTTQLLDETAKYKADSSDPAPVQRPKSLHQLGVNYRWSPIVVDEQEHGEDVAASSACYLDVDSPILCAGDRAPDAPGLAIVGGDNVETRLFDIFKFTHHTALVFDPVTDETQKIIDELSTAPKDMVKIVRIFSSESLAAQHVSNAEQTGLNLVDRDGHARNAYLAVKAGFSTIVVRPDGMVGAVLKSSGGVKTYLGKVFKL